MCSGRLKKRDLRCGPNSKEGGLRCGSSKKGVIYTCICYKNRIRIKCDLLATYAVGFVTYIKFKIRTYRDKNNVYTCNPDKYI